MASVARGHRKAAARTQGRGSRRGAAGPPTTLPSSRGPAPPAAPGRTPAVPRPGAARPSGLYRGEPRRGRDPRGDEMKVRGLRFGSSRGSHLLCPPRAPQSRRRHRSARPRPAVGTPRARLTSTRLFICLPHPDWFGFATSQV